MQYTILKYSFERLAWQEFAAKSSHKKKTVIKKDPLFSFSFYYVSFSRQTFEDRTKVFAGPCPNYVFVSLIRRSLEIPSVNLFKNLDKYMLVIRRRNGSSHLDLTEARFAILQTLAM